MAPNKQEQNAPGMWSRIAYALEQMDKSDTETLLESFKMLRLEVADLRAQVEALEALRVQTLETSAGETR